MNQEKEEAAEIHRIWMVIWNLWCEYGPHPPSHRGGCSKAVGVYSTAPRYFCNIYVYICTVCWKVIIIAKSVLGIWLKTGMNWSQLYFQALCIHFSAYLILFFVVRLSEMLTEPLTCTKMIISLYCHKAKMWVGCWLHVGGSSYSWGLPKHCVGCSSDGGLGRAAVMTVDACLVYIGLKEINLIKQRFHYWCDSSTSAFLFATK